MEYQTLILTEIITCQSIPKKLLQHLYQDVWNILKGNIQILLNPSTSIPTIILVILAIASTFVKVISGAILPHIKSNQNH